MKLIRGFTLIELMVTIVIMAIIATMAVPSFSNMIKRQRLDRDTQNLIRQFSQARSQAVILRRDVTVNLNSQTADTTTVLNWAPSGYNVLNSPSLTTVRLTPMGVTNLAADTSFSVCDKNLKVSRNFTLTRFGTVVLTASGGC
ncbi:pilus assembly FimT family protein [Acinetobacter boissieri]|uniref:Type IV fimbrial biogenesis protein FimT/type IV fimbrial biogenesis protein FimU n=1 Tax=Acinetobacter boissieri TaxID=1219383 RepID=A0A1G6I033_9GAMM|nr:prepilin-type N-terminal cleavage/methylation domain-containing protein [Acinetobacter boissieri]SDB99814.1 type IV fimbrial biogenesis protein FimT/type IV fimbrial biogenesis protein FimU [Acinetobacter boissieri]